MYRFRKVLYLAVVNILIVATSTLLAQSNRAPSGNIQDILTYINQGWQMLSRSMDECKTVSVEKFRAQRCRGLGQTAQRSPLAKLSSRTPGLSCLPQRLVPHHG
jgi:hypothetical protein